MTSHKPCRARLPIARRTVSYYNQKKIGTKGVGYMLLITGATGYIGRHLIARLVEQGERPRGLVRDIKRAESRLPADKVELALGDTTQPASLAAAVQGIETIVHTAFITADHKQSA